jgi:NAD-reducing hydrogenase small subunit
LADTGQQLPHAPGIVPELLDRVVPMDIYMPGCPPSADRIKATIEPLLNGDLPHMVGRDLIKFGWIDLWIVRLLAEPLAIERNG